LTPRTLVDWADLVTLDLRKFDQPGGKQALANQLKDAVHNVGFFYITGFGLSQDEVDEQFAIGRDLFALPTEEKVKYRADLEHGYAVNNSVLHVILTTPSNYNGYRPRGSTEVLPGKPDNVEMYNVRRDTPIDCVNSITDRQQIHRSSNSVSTLA
jgi:isopenicillin N synthase-like dioxygenase